MPDSQINIKIHGENIAVVCLVLTLNINRYETNTTFIILASIITTKILLGSTIL